MCRPSTTCTVYFPKFSSLGSLYYQDRCHRQCSVVLTTPAPTMDEISSSRNCCARYLCDGQKLSFEASAETTVNKTFVERNRKWIAPLIPLTIVYIVWWSQMFKYGSSSFDRFTDRVGEENTPAYFMSITMIFGSMIAGATSEGGAAVAFPIMTLVFGIAPPVARDFSYMIQSVGMTAAAFTILFMRVQASNCFALPTI